MLEKIKAAKDMGDVDLRNELLEEGEQLLIECNKHICIAENRALKTHALSVRLTQTNSILRSHAETIISHAFEVPSSFSEVPS